MKPGWVAATVAVTALFLVPLAGNAPAAEANQRNDFGVASSSSGISEPRMILSAADSERCPTAKDLLTVKDPDGLHRTCPDPPPRNCLQFAFKPWPSETFCYDSSTTKDPMTLSKLWSWGCRLEASDCYPKTCRIDRAMAVANYRQWQALFFDMNIPIAPPATIPAQMLADFVMRMGLARLHLAVHAASMANMDFTCGGLSEEWVDRQISKPRKPSISISFSGSLPLPKAWETARKAKSWALFAAQAVRISSQSRRYNSSGDLSVSIGQTKRKGRFSYTLDPDGTASLQVRVLG